VRLKLNGTLQLLAYADDITLLADNIDIMKKTERKQQPKLHVEG
jgi:hypothetical protein